MPTSSQQFSLKYTLTKFDVCHNGLCCGMHWK